MNLKDLEKELIETKNKIASILANLSDLKSPTKDCYLDDMAAIDEAIKLLSYSKDQKEKATKEIQHLFDAVIKLIILGYAVNTIRILTVKRVYELAGIEPYIDTRKEILGMLDNISKKPSVSPYEEIFKKYDTIVIVGTTKEKKTEFAIDILTKLHESGYVKRSGIVTSNNYHSDTIRTKMNAMRYSPTCRKFEWENLSTSHVFSKHDACELLGLQFGVLLQDNYCQLKQEVIDASRFGLRLDPYKLIITVSKFWDERIKEIICHPKTYTIFLNEQD